MVVTNHTYESMGLFSTKEMGGGSGLKYVSSIVYLSKKEKDGTDVIGNIFTAKPQESFDCGEQDGGCSIDTIKVWIVTDCSNLER